MELKEITTGNNYKKKISDQALNFVKIPEEKDEDKSEDSKFTFIYENWIEYYLLVIGYELGFGSFWRFPYLIFSNGGGIFVLIFTIILVILGVPLFYLDTHYGQLYRHGPVEFYHAIHSKYEGIGWAMVIVIWLLSLYYGSILVWSYYYFFASFVTPLPWSTVGKTDENGKPLPIINSDYFRNTVLNITDGIEDLGGIGFSKFVCLIIVYVCLYFCIKKGIHSSSKVVYVTTPAPIIILLILFFK